MNKRLAFGFCVLAWLTTGCSSDAERYCEQRDECNTIPFGQSVDDCVRAMERGFEDYSSSELEDADRVLTDCLKLESCDTFGGCWVAGKKHLPY